MCNLCRGDAKIPRKLYKPLRNTVIKACYNGGVCKDHFKGQKERETWVDFLARH